MVVAVERFDVVFGQMQLMYRNVGGDVQTVLFGLLDLDHRLLATDLAEMHPAAGQFGQFQTLRQRNRFRRFRNARQAVTASDRAFVGATLAG
ncbi:hypothetical protein [Methylomonas koyamae]|uniref:hypothetical protein n=1 Tax=Methylomonas koyamae TaxID=702114 RepID=UPI0027E48A44|nr:hypothetical protein [Methylomonas koyamae]